MSGAAGWQDICGSGYSRAVVAAAARQWRCLHEGSGGSAEVTAGWRWQCGGIRVVLVEAVHWQRQQSGHGSVAAAG